MPTNINESTVVYMHKIICLICVALHFYYIRSSDFNTTIMSHLNYGLISVNNGYFGKIFGKINDNDSVLVSWRNRSSAFISPFILSVEK